MNRRLLSQRVVALTLLAGVLGPAIAWANERPGTGDWQALQPGTVVLFRHAIAPGTGDPPGFRLDDCRTQRNLDEAGRAQAKRLGEGFRARGIAVAALMSSQWCRTRDTADLAFPGGARRDAPAFNSFFQDRARSEAQTQAARAMILGFKGPGVMVVVTHQVNITALTEIVPASGEGVIVKAEGAAIQVVGRVQP